MSDIGFPYVANRDAQVLILGSMPGQKSLKKQQYYAHPQNRFWPIMAELLGFSVELPYTQRLVILREYRIALWDVAYQCERPGSLDQAIAMHTVVVNDFAAFFAVHHDVKAIFFNGRKAQQLYDQRVGALYSLPMHLLPSTSPAHASMSRQQKLDAWRIIRHTLESA